MKKILSTLSLLFVFVITQAQKVEVSLQGYSGFNFYGGSSATGTSYINEGYDEAHNYTINPYGKKVCFSYGGALQIQHIGKKGFIAGIQVGYEVLRSQVNINGYNPLVFYLDYNTYNFAAVNYQIPVKGETFLRNQNININPYIGYRFTVKKANIDLMPGIDIGINTNSYDDGRVTDNSGKVYTTNFKMLGAPTDIRLKFAVSANVKRMGLNLSYANGLTNLDRNNTGYLKYNVHSEILRFGVNYSIF